MLSIEYGISKYTIWIVSYKNGKSIWVSKRGRTKVDDEINYKEQYEILKKFQAFIEAQRKKK